MASYLNLCCACNEDFSSVEIFDRHRVGTFEYTYSQGLKFVTPMEDGRRCLTTEEMKSKHWKQNDRGRWYDPERSDRVSIAFASRSPERAPSDRSEAPLQARSPEPESDDAMLY